MEIINATKEDARELAYLINLAGEGIPLYLWEQIKDTSESAMDVGEKRAKREHGGFSYKNAVVCKTKNKLMGMILAYKQDSHNEFEDLTGYPDVVKPLVELESLVPGSWYVNAIATYEKYRGRGVARKLMEDTGKRALVHGCEYLSLIVSSENEGAKKLYEKLGFQVKDSRPIVSPDGASIDGAWLLMIKNIGISNE